MSQNVLQLKQGRRRSGKKKQVQHGRRPHGSDRHAALVGRHCIGNFLLQGVSLHCHLPSACSAKPAANWSIGHHGHMAGPCYRWSVHPAHHRPGRRGHFRRAQAPLQPIVRNHLGQFLRECPAEHVMAGIRNVGRGRILALELNLQGNWQELV